MPTVQFDSERLYYAARGSTGVPLVFVHGAGDSHLVWNGQLAALSDIARTYALDLPGHGRSAGPGRTSVLEYASDVARLLDALELPPAIIAGTSMGGAIAQTLALDFPARVRGLVLVGTGAKLRVAPAYLGGLQKDIYMAARLLVDNYFADGASPFLKEKSFRQLLASGPGIAHGDYAACDAFDIRDRLTAIRVPALIVCGAEDRMTPPKYSEYLAAHLPSAELLIIPNAGHMVMLEQPHALNTAIRLFLRFP